MPRDERIYELDDGSSITVKQLAEMAGITGNHARKRLARMRNLQQLLQLHKCGAKEQTYRRDGEAYTISEVMARVPGLARGTVNYRLLRWAAGEISTQTLFAQKGTIPRVYRRGEPINEGNAEWKALGTKVRDANLRKMRVGRWERKQMRASG